jgi:hypothetical protein
MSATPSIQSPLTAEALIRWTDWLASSQAQATAYRGEDNGDRSEWSMYNRGRADALDSVLHDLARMLANARGQARRE